ncbi:aldehyde dehydrogenase family protein, partial [Kocuria sp.]|uniref:aldehyde dehydrogenase family protein n=1 Tax=Kocuria sp. TaxID=1871328 RepID=UPI002896A935
MAILEDNRWHGKLYVNGWRDGSGEPISVQNPASEEVLATVGSASPADVYDAARQAAAAQVAWAGLKPTERAAVLRKAGQLFEENADEIIDWVVR